MQYDGDKRVVNNVNVLDKETRNKEITFINNKITSNYS